MGFDNDHLGTLMPFGAPSTPSFRDEVRLAYDQFKLTFPISSGSGAEGLTGEC
jgi:hypothetical protein